MPGKKICWFINFPTEIGLVDKLVLSVKCFQTVKHLSLSRPGVLTDNVEMFGNSWQEAEPQQAPCPTVPPDFPSPCAAVDDHILLVRTLH